MLAALDVAREALRAGGTVEIGCFTGRGRAGTTLACLAVLDGESAADAIAHVRAGYCRQAIETSEQEAFVAETAERVRARS